ncbi:hypothetical protein DFJ73DRAFT_798409 [Zopfochytrium polystomum]|nr:hypothetical protein DFJ73DRAFT_798409 [Zopfochytrium polystomum]
MLLLALARASSDGGGGVDFANSSSSSGSSNASISSSTSSSSAVVVGELSVMAAFLIFAPSINASISMLNLIACIAQENAARRRRRLLRLRYLRRGGGGPTGDGSSSSALSSAAYSSSSSWSGSSSAAASAAAAQRPLLSLAQQAIAAATVISLLADLVMFYIVVRSSLERGWADMTKWIAFFTVLKRIHSIVAVHITFLRFQIVTGRFRSRPRLRHPRGPSAPSFLGFFTRGGGGGLGRGAANLPAVLSTAAYAALGVAAVACQFTAYVANDWSLARSKYSPAFKAYRAVSLVATTYFAAVGLYTDVALVALTARLFRPDDDKNAATAALPPKPLAVAASPPPLSASASVSSFEHLTLTLTRAPPPPTPASATAPPSSSASSAASSLLTSPLTRVKKYYNHSINLAYEIVLFLAFVALSVAFFFDPSFHASVFVEQALLAFVAWNGYVLLHVAVRDSLENDGGGSGQGGDGGGGAGEEEGRWKTTGAPAEGWRVDPVLPGRAAAASAW